MYKIAEIFAFIVTDPQGGEGVVRRNTPIGTQPAIADSAERLEAFRDDATAAARQMNLPLSVARFVRVDELPNAT